MYFDAIKIIKGRQVYSVGQFWNDLRDLYFYDERTKEEQEILDIHFNRIVLGMAFKTNENSWFLDYKRNILSAFDLIIDKYGHKKPDCFNIGHAFKFNLVDLEYKLLASFYSLKFSKLEQTAENLKFEDEIVKKFTVSYNSFRDDWSDKLGALAQAQKEELEKRNLTNTKQ